MYKNKQQSFWRKPGISYGGNNKATGRRKTARAIATRRAMHVVLKSSHARGKWSMLKHARGVDAAVQATAKRFYIRVYRQENVGNHLHLLVKANQRHLMQKFLKALPQAIMFLITGAKKGSPKGKFWDHLVFTRTVEWGRDWFTTKNYLEKNRFEALGVPRDVVDLWFEETAPAPG